MVSSAAISQIVSYSSIYGNTSMYVRIMATVFLTDQFRFAIFVEGHLVTISTTLF